MHTFVSFLKKTQALIFISIFLTSCVTTSTGPKVSTSEVAGKRSELEIKAKQFKETQVKRISLIAQRIISFMPAEDQARIKGLRYEVDDDSKVNAYVAPGRLVVTYGLLRFTESDDELAAMIGHELAHITKGHFAKKKMSDITATVTGIAATIAIEALTNGSGFGMNVGQGVAGGVSGSFSREIEREADYFGFQYLYLAGFDIIVGASVWERFAVELPSSMQSNLFSTHPSSPERLVRAEKTIHELVEQGLMPDPFRRPQTQSVSHQQSLITKALSTTGRVIGVPVSAVGSALREPVKGLGGESSSEGTSLPDGEAASAVLSDADREISILREEITNLKQAAEEQRKNKTGKMRQSAKEKREFEEALLEAKEASKQLRYAEFGIQDMGLAKKVTNLLVGKRVKGEQRIFSVDQGRVDWFIQYNYWSVNSFKALALMHRKYRVYWYAPDGRIFMENDFLQSKFRAEFAKTTLEWDPMLGNMLKGVWLMRVFENGKLLDERNFELV